MAWYMQNSNNIASEGHIFREITYIGQSLTRKQQERKFTYN